VFIQLADNITLVTCLNLLYPFLFPFFWLQKQVLSILFFFATKYILFVGNTDVERIFAC
jgi:hypothetical protein